MSVECLFPNLLCLYGHIIVVMDIRSLLNGPLKIRHLVLVLTIAEQGSIVGAARHLYITQPAVSRGLREVEEALGAPLFERGARGVRPTPFAEVFIDHARAVVGHLKQATQHIAELADATAGSVTVGTYVAGGNLLLPKAIALLKQQRPHVNIYVHEATPDRLTNGLVAGEIDVVVGRLTAQHGVPELQQAALYHEPFEVVARVGHPVLDLGPTTLADLRKYPWVMPVGQTALRGELERAFARAARPARGAGRLFLTDDTSCHPGRNRLSRPSTAHDRSRRPFVAPRGCPHQRHRTNCWCDYVDGQVAKPRCRLDGAMHGAGGHWHPQDNPRRFANKPKGRGAARYALTRMPGAQIGISHVRLRQGSMMIKTLWSLCPY